MLKGGMLQRLSIQLSSILYGAVRAGDPFGEEGVQVRRVPAAARLCEDESLDAPRGDRVPGLTDFKCELCGREFAQERGLAYHSISVKRSSGMSFVHRRMGQRILKQLLKTAYLRRKHFKGDGSGRTLATSLHRS
jgi:hypothetical protein